jgi:hypothetical protein
LPYISELDQYSVNRRRSGENHHLTKNPYPEELETVCNTLSRLRNIRVLTVAGPSSRKGIAPPAGYLNELFHWLGMNYHGLVDLAILVPVNVTVLQGFPKLRAISFSGFCTPSGKKLGRIFEQLQFLETPKILCIKAPNQPYSRRLITGDAIRQMRPLKNLTIREGYPRELGEYCILYSQDICNALQETHGDCLESLTAISDYNLAGGYNERTTKKLLGPLDSFISRATALETLTLGLSDFDARLLTKLPQSMESLGITVDRKHLLVENVYLKCLHSRLPLLRQVRFRLAVVRGSGRGTRQEEVWKFESSDFGQTQVAG